MLYGTYTANALSLWVRTVGNITLPLSKQAMKNMGVFTLYRYLDALYRHFC